MAQLAAQDYFSRLQASGFGQMPFSQSDLAAGFPPGLAASMGMAPMNGNASSGGGGGGGGGGGASSRGGNDSKGGSSRNKKDRKGNNNNSSNNSAANSYQVRT